MTTTPDQARELLDNFVMAWEPPEEEMFQAAPDMAETIAVMEYDYGIQQPRPEPHMAGHLTTSWGYRLSAAKATYAGLTDHGVECHIVRRLVGPTETAGDLV